MIGFHVQDRQVYRDIAYVFTQRREGGKETLEYPLRSFASLRLCVKRLYRDISSK